MVAVCDSYFPQVGIHLRQDQWYTIILQQFVTTSYLIKVNWIMTDPIYSLSH